MPDMKYSSLYDYRDNLSRSLSAELLHWGVSPNKSWWKGEVWGMDMWGCILALPLISILKLDRTPDICKQGMITHSSLGHGEDCDRMCESHSHSAWYIVGASVKIWSAASRKHQTHPGLNNKGVYCFMSLNTQRASFRIGLIQLPNEVTGSFRMLASCQTASFLLARWIPSLCRAACTSS